MEIRKIDIVFWKHMPLVSGFPDKRTDVKSLPYFSIVQAKKGCYEIKLDNSPIFQTGEGGFFIAPSGVRQTITHHIPANGGQMYARWLFIDARINDKYTLEEIFSFPIIIDAKSGKELDECFDKLETADSYCEKMSILYHIIGLMIDFSEREKSPEADGIRNAVKYMHRNYTQKITVSELAKIANMSESNFYAAFKKKYSYSPLEYVNHLRLSVAMGMLDATSASVGSIANDVGIRDAFYFSKLFKKSYGISPSAYRIYKNKN